MKDEHKYLIITLSVIIILSGGLFSYQFYQFKELNTKLIQVGLDLTIRTNELDTKLNLETSSIKGTITSMNQETDKRLKDMLQVISEVEQKTQIQLGKVKEDLQSEITGLETNLQGDFTKVIKDAIKATVSVVTNVGQGSGAIINQEGKVVTNAHVISGASQIAIRTHDKEMYLVKIIGVEPNKDLAVLMPINTNRTFDYFKFGNSDKLQVGEKVIALGNPFGLDFTATQGIVSATNRIAQNGLSYIQIDVPINPGNSGGPLINDEGRIIGINNFKVGSGEGLGFAIPSNTVQDAVDELT